MKKATRKLKIMDDYEIALLEEVRSHVMALGEGQSVLSDQIKGLNTKYGALSKNFESLDVKVGSIDFRLSKVEGRLDKIEKKTDNLDRKVDNLEDKVDSMASDVIEIKHKLSQKVDLEDFQKLEKKVLKLEKLILSRAV